MTALGVQVNSNKAQRRSRDVADILDIADLIRFSRISRTGLSIDQKQMQWLGRDSWRVLFCIIVSPTPIGRRCPDRSSRASDVSRSQGR